MDGCHSNAAWFTFCRETNFPSLSPSYCCWLSPYFYTTHLSGLFLENCSFFSARSPSASCFPVNWIIACSWALCKCWLSCSWFFLGSLNCFEFFFWALAYHWRQVSQSFICDFMKSGMSSRSCGTCQSPRSVVVEDVRVPNSLVWSSQWRTQFTELAMAILFKPLCWNTEDGGATLWMNCTKELSPTEAVHWC